MLYRPSSKISYGIHKGFEIYKIYQFAPDYLEWLIEYVNDFEIDLEDFVNLSKPTPFIRSEFQLVENKNLRFEYQFQSEIVQAEIFIQNGNKINEAEFCFSIKIREILILKKQGLYNPPHYTKKTFNKTDFIDSSSLF